MGTHGSGGNPGVWGGSQVPGCPPPIAGGSKGGQPGIWVPPTHSRGVLGWRSRHPGDPSHAWVGIVGWGLVDLGGTQASGWDPRSLGAPHPRRVPPLAALGGDAGLVRGSLPGQREERSRHGQPVGPGDPAGAGDQQPPAPAEAALGHPGDGLAHQPLGAGLLPHGGRLARGGSHEGFAQGVWDEGSWMRGLGRRVLDDRAHTRGLHEGACMRGFARGVLDEGV